MKPIAVHVAEQDYQQFKSLAARRRRPVAQLIRDAMAAYLQQEKRMANGSVLDLQPHDSGELRKGWRRDELHEEMRRR